MLLISKGSWFTIVFCETVWGNDSAISNVQTPILCGQLLVSLGGLLSERRSWLRWLLIIHFRQRGPTCSNCLHKVTKSNIPGLPYPPSTGYPNCILQWRHQKKMKKSSCSQPAQLLQRGHLTIQVAAQATHVCCGAEWTLLSLYFDQMKVSDRITSTAWCNRQRRKWTLNFGPSMGWFAKWPSANMKHHLNSQGASSWKRLEPFPSTPFMCSTWPPCPLKWAAYGMKSNDLRWFSGAQENQRKWKHWRILLHLPLEPTLSQYYLSKKICCIFCALVFTRAAWFHWPTWNQLQVDSPAAQHLHKHSQRCSVIWLRPWRWMATYLLRSADGILLLPSLQGWRTIKSCWKSQGELENEDGKYMTLPLIGFIL